jgi:hypothetical protein
MFDRQRPSARKIPFRVDRNPFKYSDFRIGLTTASVRSAPEAKAAAPFCPHADPLVVQTLAA